MNNSGEFKKFHRQVFIVSYLFKFYYTFHYHVLKMFKKCLKNVIHQIDSKNGWLLFPAGFTAKFGLIFVLTLVNAFS